MLSYDTPKLRARFAAKTDRNREDGCWLWIGSRQRERYGFFVAAGKVRLAHRVAWELANGAPIPDGLCVLHNCPAGDNPGCVNPSHLWLGTNADNTADAKQKGRLARGEHSGAATHPERLPWGDRNGMRTHPETMVRGERSHLAKLTAADVLEIRRVYANGGISQARLGARYGISDTAIGDIVRRRCWKHV